MPDPHVRVLDANVRPTYVVGGTPEDEFIIPFTFYENGNVKAYNGDTLIDDSDYTILGNSGTDGGYEGGVLKLDTPVSDTLITLLLDIDIERTTDFPVSADFKIPSLNTQLDKAFSILQQLSERIGRAARLKNTSALTTLEFVEDPQDGKFPLYSTADGGFINGPDADQIANAQQYAVDAAAALAACQVIYDNFDDRYLGQKSSAPTVDNDGNALIDGALYYNTVDNKMYVYDLGTTTWLAIETNITDGSVTAPKIATGAVIAGKLANGAVDTAARIVDGIITYAKLAAATIASISDVVSATASKLVNATILREYVGPWVAYTPVFTAFGTVTNVSVFSKRDGDTLKVRGRFTAGVATGSEARMSLGYNGTSGSVTMDSTKNPSGGATCVSGCFAFGGEGVAPGYILAAGSNGYVTFGIQSASAVGAVSQTGSVVTSTSTTISFSFEVPISGW